MAGRACRPRNIGVRELLPRETLGYDRPTRLASLELGAAHTLTHYTGTWSCQRDTAVVRTAVSRIEPPQAEWWPEIAAWERTEVDGREEKGILGN